MHVAFINLQRFIRVVGRHLTRKSKHYTQKGKEHSIYIVHKSREHGLYIIQRSREHGKYIAQKGKHGLVKVHSISRVAFSDKYLIYANVTISVILGAFGDLLEQFREKIAHNVPNYNLTRTRNMALAGCTVGVLCHYWYLFLDRRIPGKAVKNIVQKVILDQLICSPLTIVVFFATLGLLENSNVDVLINEVKKKAWQLYIAEWIIWPPAQAFNFYILPTKFRVLYDSTISLGYDIYTSYIINSDKLEIVSNNQLSLCM